MRLVKGVLGTLCAVGLVQAAQFCNLSFQACPKDFSGTVSVPKEAIWLDPIIPVCSEVIQVSKQTSPPPSIMLIIDNSGSMSNTDPNEQRFRVTRDLLDTLYKIAPKTEVGLAVFSRRLSFDNRDNAYFKPAYPGDTSQHDAYFPLTTLDAAFPNGVLGIDSLKAMLEFKDNGNLTHATMQPSSRANATAADIFDVRGGTDISLGFDAGREAMKAAKNTDKNNQFFVFLSDGNPTGLDDSRRGIAEYQFVAGANTPTTFTVFFLDTKNNATDSIQKMTDNIKANGYSTTSNPKSAYYEARLTGSGQLAPLLMNNVLGTILDTYKTTAASAVLTSNGGAPVTSVSVDSKNFTFPTRIPLAPDQTQVKLTAKYSYTDDQGVKRDTTFNYTLNIQRTNASAYPPNAAKASCYDGPDIAVYSDGNPISIITADHDSVQIRVTLPSGETCNNCRVGVIPSKSIDSESVALSPTSGVIAGILHRGTSNTPINLNGKLEHLPTDSIVVIFTNPNNPLERVREAFPYNDIRSTLSAGPIQFHFDGKLKPSEVTVKANTHWLIAGNNVKVENPSQVDAVENIDPTLPAIKNDSASVFPFPGVKIESSRSFRADVWTFTNFGELVDKFSFNISQAEFEHLPKGAKSNTRILKLYWVPKGTKGQAAATGAYVMKYNITLNRIPGIAEDQKTTTAVKILGYVRPK